jgi:hypothetical protein
MIGRWLRPLGGLAATLAAGESKLRGLTAKFSNLAERESQHG